MTVLIPVVNLPNLYINNLQTSWVSTTSLSVASGQARDSTNTNDIILSSTATLSSAVSGANGLDSGTIAASTWYFVHVIGSSANLQSTAILLSLSQTAPNLPLQYDMFRCVGVARTDSSSHFLQFFTSGNSNQRWNVWQSPITVLSGGSATSSTPISCIAAAPAINNTQLGIIVSFTPAHAGDIFYLSPYSFPLNQILVGQIDTGIMNFKLTMLSKLNSSNPSLIYQVTSGDTATIIVTEFEYFL